MQENIVILGTGFIAGYLNRGLHYLFSELRQPMVGNVCAIGKHPEKLASRTNILKDCVLCTDPIDAVHMIKYNQKHGSRTHKIIGKIAFLTLFCFLLFHQIRPSLFACAFE